MSAADEEYKRKLIERYVAGEASEKELQAFFGLLTEAEIDSLIGEHMDQEILRLREEKGLIKPVKRLKIWKYVAAASILVFLSLGAYYIFHKQVPKDQYALNKTHDIKPGGNKAILTLGNGQQISLTDAKSGMLASQGKTTITKTDSGKVVYNAGSSVAANEITYNTISTPRAGKWDAVLPDGSKVWLDAASSIRFPTVFTGNNRTVEITGQAYFEVVHNAAKPFRVMVKGQMIQDIGTHFNINAYDDEPVIRTTLLEGSVSIAKNNHEVILKPGQQGITQQGSDAIKIKPADTEEVLAWKNDLFLFDDEGLQSVMRKVSRWYDVDIEYPSGQTINESYGGSITRYSNVSEVLNMLQVTGNVKFTIDGKKILVQKK